VKGGGGVPAAPEGGDSRGGEMSQGEEEGDVTRREIDIAEVREMTSLDVMSMDASVRGNYIAGNYLTRDLWMTSVTARRDPPVPTVAFGLVPSAAINCDPHRMLYH